MAMAILHHNAWCIFAVYWILIGNIQGQQLCKNWNETTNIVHIQMDTSPITGQNGMCSCRMTVDNTSKVSMFPYIQSPNCNTNIELVDSPYIFKCQNNKIEYPPYSKNHTAGYILWLVVSTTVTSDQNLSGTLQIKTAPTSEVSNPMFTIECYNPNTNSSSPLTTSVNTSTTTDQSTSTDKEITATSVSATVIIPTSSRSAATTLPTASHTTTTETASVDTTATRSSSTTATLSRIISSPDASNGHTDTGSTDGKSSPGEVAAVAGGVVAALVVMVTVISAVILLRRCQNHRLNQEPVSDIPPSETHPTYSGLVAGGNTTYDHIKQSHQDSDYYNVSATNDYENV